jgi:hypothetical protein
MHPHSTLILFEKYILNRTIGKIQELRIELNSDKKDRGYTRKKATLKKIVANMTMGNDMSSLYPDVVACMAIPVLEVKKMVYLFLINYAKGKPEMALEAISTFRRVNRLPLWHVVWLDPFPYSLQAIWSVLVANGNDPLLCSFSFILSSMCNHILSGYISPTPRLQSTLAT